MQWETRALTRADVETIAGWRYAAPYDVYNDFSKGVASGAFRALCGADETLCGAFSWGTESRVFAAADLYTAQPDWLDFGVGLAPDLAGRGHGVMACTAALRWLQGAFHPAAFRLAVYEWNVRARRVYARLGFLPQTKRGDFLIMIREERPWRDATHPLENGMPVYPFDPGFDRHLHYRKQDTGWDMSAFSMSAHTGTHIDAPAHVGMRGDTESIQIERWNGTVQLLDWAQPNFSALRAPRLLLKTGGRGLAPEEARRLVAAGAEMIGVDGMSVGEGKTEHAVHTLLLSQGVGILENAMLDGFSPGWYEMRCLPLRMPGSDGAPVRLLLREESAW